MTPVKPKNVILVKPSNTLAKRIRGLNFSQFAEELDVTDLVDDIFKKQPSTSPQLDVIVQFPASGKWQYVNNPYCSVNFVLLCLDCSQP